MPIQQVHRGRIAPPPLPVHYLDRRRLLDRLAEAAEQRVALVVAGPGYGKTTLLAAFARQRDCVWFSLERENGSLATFMAGLVMAIRERLSMDVLEPVAPLGPDPDPVSQADAAASSLIEAIERAVDNVVVILDDLHELPAGSPSALLVESLCRQAPANLHLVLSSRYAPPFPVSRLRGRGQLVEIDSSSLALTADETARMVAAQLHDDPLGSGPSEIGAAVHELTEGWAAAVCLATEAVRQSADAKDRLRALRTAGGALASYLAEEVIDAVEPEVRELLSAVAPLRRFTASLAGALGVSVSQKQLAQLAQRGLLIGPSSDAEPTFRLPAVLASAVDDGFGPGRVERAQAAAAWMVEHGWLIEGLHAVRTLQDPTKTVAYLEHHGPTLLASGHVTTVVAAIGEIPDQERTSAIELLRGHALQVQGDWSGALVCFERLASSTESLPPSVAWRMGLIHYFRGHHAQALQALQRAELVTEQTADEATVLAWMSSTHWMMGQHESCRTTADRALRAAVASGDDGAIATAHTAKAMAAAMDGDRTARTAHYGYARQAAERSGDLLALIRVCNNVGSKLLDEGHYRESIGEFGRAIELADRAGFRSLYALALHNRGEAHRGLGNLTEAAADYADALTTYRGLDSRQAAYPLLRLAEVHRERGDLAMARAGYEEALAHAERGSDAQGTVPALCGLARTIVDDDPDRATALVERAVSFGDSTKQVEALLAAGWVALARRDREAARGWATRAAQTARSRGHPAGIAQALELAVLTADEPAGELDQLGEANRLWQTIGDQYGLAINAALTAKLTGQPTEPTERQLHALGVRTSATLAAGPLHHAGFEHAQPEVLVRTLGGFHVLRNGSVLGAQVWRSKKASDLLKVLIARRGHPTQREVLGEALWPGEDFGAVSNRLAVALSTLRSVLDPDRQHPQDHYVRTDKGTIGLSDLDIDVERFLLNAATGFAARDAGRNDEARSYLDAAEAAYTGDFLEDNPYDDWAIPLREEARATYIAVSRALMDLGEDLDVTIRYAVRLLERDPYDEDMHLGLVASLSRAGRHGEARRRYRLYRKRMAELDIEPAPMGTLDPVDATSS